MNVHDQERRASNRYELRLPLRIAGQTVSAETCDVSARGVKFLANERVSAGAEVEFSMILPSSLTATNDIEVLCQGEVVRVSEQGDGRMSVAVRIDRYRFSESQVN